MNEQLHCVECLGYKVYENGNIYNKHNKALQQHLITRQIKANINGKLRNIPIAKFIYYAFNNDFNYTDSNIVITFKDGNENNLAIDNLVLEYRANYLQGENNSCSKLTNEQVNEIINKYKQGEKRYTYKQLAKEYGVSVTLICQIINKKARNERNYKMKIK